MTDRNSSSKEIIMTKVTDLIEQLKDDSSDFVYHERHEAAAELLRLSSECEALRESLGGVLSVVDGLYRKYGTQLDTDDTAVVQATRTTLQETNGGGNADVS